MNEEQSARPFLTILTATYNRADKLPSLYASLLAQDDRGFVWLIVDDGSADGTKALAEQWIRDGCLTIEYIQRENGGKHRALNTGLKQVSSPLTFIVDSDDTLLPDAVRQIRGLYGQYGLRADLCGYSLLKVDRDGKSVASKGIGGDAVIGTFARVRLRGNIDGDMAEVWFTDILRKFPFPEFPGEKFYSETGVWLRMSGHYKVVFTNIPAYVCAYYDDGLTKNRAKAQRLSPRGVVDSSLQVMRGSCGLKWSVRACLRYCVFAKRLGWTAAKTIQASGRPLLALICYVPSMALRKRWADK